MCHQRFAFPAIPSTCLRGHLGNSLSPFMSDVGNVLGNAARRAAISRSRDDVLFTLGHSPVVLMLGLCQPYKLTQRATRQDYGGRSVRSGGRVRTHAFRATWETRNTNTARSDSIDNEVKCDTPGRSFLWWLWTVPRRDSAWQRWELLDRGTCLSLEIRSPLARYQSDRRAMPILCARHQCNWNPSTSTPYREALSVTPPILPLRTAKKRLIEHGVCFRSTASWPRVSQVPGWLTSPVSSHAGQAMRE